MAYQDSAQFSVGDVLTRMGHVLQQSVKPAAVYLLVLSVLGIIAELLSADSGTVSMGALMQLIVGIVGIIAGYLLIEAMLRGTGMLSAEGPRRYLAYLGQSILIMLGVSLGLMLLVVPGIYLGCRWVIASIVLIGEQERAVDAMKISWDATRGHAWKIFLASLVLLLIVAVVVGLGGSLMAVNVTVGLMTFQIAVSVAGVIYSAFLVALYGLLRSPAGHLQDVFA